MTSTPIVHPAKQLGREIDALLDDKSVCFQCITFVSSFVALRTILRLRDKLLAHAQRGCHLRFVVGIDLGGTSRDVLEELLRWKTCDVFVIHNALEHVTFHPKVYLFERAESATLFVGSNNLTDGGFYTNYEASVRHDFVLPQEDKPFGEIVTPLRVFLNPTPDGRTIRQLDRDLIDMLTERGALINEQEARSKREALRLHRESSIPDNPFRAVAVPL